MARSKNQRSKSKSKKGAPRRVGPVISFKDVIMAYYMGGQGAGGVKEIRKLAKKTDDNGNQAQLTPKVLWSAYDALAEAPDADLETLEKFVLKTAGPRRAEGTRGRSLPQAGETRQYKAMTTPVKDDDGNETGRSDPFVRIPVSALEVEGGAMLEASFENGRIILTPASSPQS